MNLCKVSVHKPLESKYPSSDLHEKSSPPILDSSMEKYGINFQFSARVITGQTLEKHSVYGSLHLICSSGCGNRRCLLRLPSVTSRMDNHYNRAEDEREIHDQLVSSKQRGITPEIIEIIINFKEFWYFVSRLLFQGEWGSQKQRFEEMKTVGTYDR